jgi:hypothetical protein
MTCTKDIPRNEEMAKRINWRSLRISRTDETADIRVKKQMYSGERYREKIVDTIWMRAKNRRRSLAKQALAI